MSVVHLAPLATAGSPFHMGHRASPMPPDNHIWHLLVPSGACPLAEPMYSFKKYISNFLLIFKHLFVLFSLAILFLTIYTFYTFSMSTRQ